MTAVEHSPVNRAGEGDQSQAVPRTPAFFDPEVECKRCGERMPASERHMCAGVYLTKVEARLAERALREYGAEPYTLDYSDSDAMDALAARLEVAS